MKKFLKENWFKTCSLFALSFFIAITFYFYNLIASPIFNTKKDDISDLNKNSQVELLNKQNPQERLRADVKFLTEINPPRNYKNIDSLNKAMDYILAEFKKLNCETEIQEFSAKDNVYRNIIASFGPKDAKEILVIGAHYDVDGDQSGADDNASGVAGLLELARMLDENKPNLKKRIDLVAYSNEELPFFRTEFMGSAVHAKKMKMEEKNVELMVSLEMLGYYTDEENSQKYPTSALKIAYPNKGNFIAIVGRISDSDKSKRFKEFFVKTADIDTYSLNAPENLRGIDFSDHQNYWKEGYNAIMITDTSFYRNKNYHKKSDTIDTLNFEKMAEVVKGIYDAITNF